MSKKVKLRPDFNETAFRVVQEAIGALPKTAPPSERPDGAKNPKAVTQGAKGGIARRGKLTAKRRKAIAREAAMARWKNRPT
jgi:hypothetical protein